MDNDIDTWSYELGRSMTCQEYAEKKLSWFAGEIDHWKERCRELEIELVIAQGNFGSLENVNLNLDAFDGSWEVLKNE